MNGADRSGATLPGNVDSRGIGADWFGATLAGKAGGSDIGAALAGTTACRGATNGGADGVVEDGPGGVTTDTAAGATGAGGGADAVTGSDTGRATGGRVGGLAGETGAETRGVEAVGDVAPGCGVTGDGAPAGGAGDDDKSGSGPAVLGGVGAGIVAGGSTLSSFGNCPKPLTTTCDNIAISPAEAAIAASVSLSSNAKPTAPGSSGWSPAIGPWLIPRFPSAWLQNRTIHRPACRVR